MLSDVGIMLHYKIKNLTAGSVTSPPKCAQMAR